MNEIEKAIEYFDGYGTPYDDIVIQALQEKAEREERMQWLDDLNNPLEPIKVQAALGSEMLKYNYRKEHKPDSISPLDYTIIYALNKVLEDELKGGAE
jgi:hypothetical protein